MHVKVVELVGESSAGWQEAVVSAIAEASQSIKNISGVEVCNFTANVQNGKLQEYKANVKIAYTE